MSSTSICCLAVYSNDTVLTLKLVGEEKIILENYSRKLGSFRRVTNFHDEQKGSSP